MRSEHGQKLGNGECVQNMAKTRQWWMRSEHGQN